MPDYWMVWRCHGILCVHFFCLFVCLFRSNVKKWYLDERDFRQCYGNFFESAMPKVIGSQLCWSFFSIITRHINNTNLKDTLRLKILWTWIKIRANSFIKTLLNMMKRKSARLLWKVSPTKKNTTSYFKEQCIKIDDISLAVMRFFFFQINPVFKSNAVFIWHIK